jgi:hypothetical protein
MPLRHLLEHRAFDPQIVEELVAAFDFVCSALGLAERDDPLRRLVAQRVIALAESGVVDRIRLREETLREFQSAPHAKSSIDGSALPRSE